MANTGLPPISADKDRTFTADEIQAMKDDVKELEKLGFEIPAISVQGENVPQYALKPPAKEALHKWRLALEKTGFEVVSKLKPDELGFAASRRAVQGDGWK